LWSVSQWCCQYTRGAYVSGMGRHWIKSMQHAPNFVYDAFDFFPVVQMFDPTTRNLTAVFFMATSRQQSLLPPATNGWDIIALPDALMCRCVCFD